MDISKIEAAIVDARRFMERAGIVKNSIECEARYKGEPPSPKDIASLRRASLDLTRALSELRRND
jgi:predicted transcriptional regulator